ncbi:MAG: ADP-ribosylation factor-like protein [Candidatus Kariarchaeaceae archaeon]|jgi:signal recognition particle receptor subunit beta
MQETVITIRTLECDVCRRFDSIILTKEEILVRAKVTDMDIGAYSVVHNDHTRIVYFDKEGQYLGDTIAMSEDEVPENLKTQPLPYYVRNQEKMGVFKKMRSVVFSRLHTRNLTISVAGPSRAGKTSFVRYLETLIPERDSSIITSVPTMGKSTKHVKLGKTSITTLDMGGQQDFWELWTEPVSRSDAVIFIVDGTSNNTLEVAKAFEKVMDSRREETPVLVILNKKDLSLKGSASRFLSSGEFLALTNLELPLKNVLAIEASIFEGIAYSTVELEEVPLAEIVTSYIADEV